MKEAIGSALSFKIIIFILIVINCYLAFNVNYTKAFRSKNEILSIIQKNNGLTCDALDQVYNFMINNNYMINANYADWCRNNGYEVAVSNQTNMFCYKKHTADTLGTGEGKNAYYTVATFVNVEIPLINNLLPFTANLFIVKGETPLIYSTGNNTELTGCIKS